MRKVRIKNAFSVHFVFLELEHFGHTPTGRGGSLKEGKGKLLAGGKKSSQRWRSWSSSDIRIHPREELPWRLAEWGSQRGAAQTWPIVDMGKEPKAMGPFYVCMFGGVILH